MKRILSLTVVVLSLAGCAYGSAPQDEPVYGHTKGPTSNDDGGYGSSDWGGGGDGVPYGCIAEVIKVEGQLPLVLTICPQNFEPAFRWLVDPPPMSPIRQDNRQKVQ